MAFDQESIVYGCIKDIYGVGDDRERRRKNRKSILSLPQADEWPYLSREMFALPQVERISDQYQTEVIHFGSSYRAIEYEWQAWMEKFELLLSDMFWVSAVVHLDTELPGIHTFTWESKITSHSPGDGRDQVRREWSQELSLV